MAVYHLYPRLLIDHVFTPRVGAPTIYIVLTAATVYLCASCINHLLEEPPGEAEMLLLIVLSGLKFIISNGFSFDKISGNVTAGTLIELHWNLDSNSDTEELIFERRNLISQSSGQGDYINTVPNQTNGTLNVTFPSPGKFLIEVVNKKTQSVRASSNTFYAAPRAETSPSSIVSPSSQGKTGSRASPSSGSAPANGSVLSQTKTASFLSPSSSSPHSETSSALSSQSRILEIVGAAVGTFVFLLVLLGTLIYTLHRRQRGKRYPAIFHRDMMVRKRSNPSLSPLTPTTKDSDTYSNDNLGKDTSYNSRNAPDRDDLAKGFSEYSLPAPLGNRPETPSPVSAYTDRQMELHDVVVKLKMELIRLKTELRRGGDVKAEIDAVKRKITGLEDSFESAWALEHTHDIPINVSNMLISR
ncbi:uncharacterized protein BT62DRAFT_938995 [Guyanagaster necrorhizus]|uniref:Uncharacterized protein n=1 Tax=Guyanagaster necrorhizus TaxID=856835 RepID=A0A9P7VEH5_9AGAR|nr:uncharacterized protein BT62DRAFT_938995 [Guyanagaster necrorhizus MCA 3950]KAG7439441.1 hypothetical protein BT62DRAFT_938995 [Guyanagaster necrorhizus MCA 3950]